MVCLVCAEPSADAVDLAINSDTAIPAQPAASDSQGVAQKRSLIRIGVLVKGSVADCAIRYKPTADYLTSEIKEYRFVIVPIRYDSFMDTVTHEKVDFVICNPLLYVDLHAIGKISAIATMQENFNGMNFSQLGGVVFCLRDREDIKKISSIREKSFAAVSEDSFGGWVACQAFLLEKGIDPIEDASRFAFLGTHSEVVREVAEGIYDVGAVRTGTLERMAQAGTIDMDDIRIFNVISPTDRFPFFSSTELYPEWVFAKTASVKESLANRVATVLYAMPEDSDAAYRGHYAGWVTPASYQSVRECTEKVHSPFVKKRGVWGWFHEVYGFFSVMLIGLVVAFYYVFALKRKLRATNALMDHHVEEIVVKDKLIQDLRQRVGLAVGEEHQDINIIRSDYRIEYLTPKLEKEYGPGVGQYCYEYFAGRSHPCEECSLREAIKTQQITKVRKPFAREGGQPLEVTTIPLAKSSEGVQRFGQVFCDIMLHTRKVRSLTASQEREVNSVIFKGVVSQYKKRPEKSKEFLHKACNLICEETPPKKVIDINETVQKIADLTSHVWRDIAGVSFDLAV
ncbi:MAG: phosphate/phosphite/phosphonate ABC transporter substrate-binding protein, partial [Planctomycetia bacterium]